LSEGTGLSEPSGPTELPVPGRYRHFKGGEYDVLGLARIADGEREGELAVVYRPRYDVPEPALSVRSLASWQTAVPGGGPRFRRVD
jgi:hypothetical protein